jgi:hypothetical protein
MAFPMIGEVINNLGCSTSGSSIILQDEFPHPWPEITKPLPIAILLEGSSRLLPYVDLVG